MPSSAIIFTDAMTSSRGNTPKAGVERHSKPGKTILNRVFGTQIICGPVEFMMFSNVDQMQMGGANLAIEIQRLAMEKLSIELEKRHMLMPSIMNFQFDNCRENKVIFPSISSSILCSDDPRHLFTEQRNVLLRISSCRIRVLRRNEC